MRRQARFFVGAAALMTLYAGPVYAQAEGEPVGGVFHEMVRYDKGASDEMRVFRNAEMCTLWPCVVTQHAAIKFNIQEAGQFKIRMAMLHRGIMTRIDHLEKRGLGDYVLVERVFNRKRNKKIYSLLERIEDRELDTLFIYGVALQYELDDGDPIIMEIEDTKNPEAHKTYFFRFHKAGAQLKFDIALLYALNAGNWPEPEPAWRNTGLNIAATFALQFDKDPEANYGTLTKILLAGYPTIFMGLVKRQLDHGPIENKDSQTDMFAGIGFTFLDFFFFGWGANVIQKPHTTSPFVGIHLNKFIQFLRDVNRGSAQKWDDYLDSELKKKIMNEEEPVSFWPPPPAPAKLAPATPAPVSTPP